MTRAELADEIAALAVRFVTGRVYFSRKPNAAAVWLEADYQRKSYVLGYARGFLAARPPRFPTPAMMDAGSEVQVFLKEPGHLSDGSAERVWCAMDAARQQAPR